MNEFVTSGRIRGGHLQVRNRRSFEQAVSRFRDGEVDITIQRKHATRNIEQNALYWVGYVKPLAEAFGWTQNDMHAYLKARFLPQHKRKTKTLLLHDPRTGEVFDEFDLDLSTTTNLNKIEFGDYLRDIGIWAGEKGVDVGSNREAA